MLDPGADAQIAATRKSKDAGSAWRVYGRLIRYALKYKGRLLVSLIFALIIASSFTAILFGVGAVIDLTFYSPEFDADGVTLEPDPADEYLAQIAGFNDRLEAVIGTAPRGIEGRFERMVMAMRSDTMGALMVACVIVVLLSLIIGIARFLQEYFAGSIGASITTDLGAEMYGNLMRQSVGFFEARSSGEILARFTNDIFMVNRGLAGVFVKLMREPLKAIAFLSMAVLTDAWLTMVGVVVLPPVAWVLIKIGKKVRRSVRRSLEKVASMASVVNETVNGIVIVKGYNMEAYETERVRGEIGKLRRFLLQMVRLDAATAPITEFMLILGIVAFVLLSGYRVNAGLITPGDLTVLFGALALTLDPIRKLSSVNNMIQTSVASAERVFEFIDMRSDIVEAPDAVTLNPLSDSIRFDGVDFSYDGKAEVLRGVDLEIRKGEMVALVGFSGAGKSTIVKLIPRFYDVNSGAITIDGVDIREATFQSLRDQIGIVTQDTILFAESVRDNIAFGQQSFSAERVEAAAKAAHADEFIRKMPEGYDTVLGESGVTLSGGQRQRLAIARAIVKDPAILILDEATSSLDSESERLIQEALDKFVEGRTTIVIAHRLSTVQRADRIVVLEEGRIAEQGTHDELLAKDGIYRRLYDTQFGKQHPAA